VVGPPLAPPDLAVKLEKVSCGPYQEGGVHLLCQVRITNMENAPAQGTWQTDIKLDGVAVAGSPKFTTGPLYGSIVHSFNVPNLTPGHYLAEWRFGRLTLDVLVLPNRVTRVDWRVASVGRETDRMVPIAAPAHLPAELSA